MAPSTLVVWVDNRRCNGCHLCLRVGRYSALNWVPGEEAVWADPWQSNGCGSC
jgi:TPP-dependent indolepyruvate ferredoxin oxidoreductase alpha subunit